MVRLNILKKTCEKKLRLLKPDPYAMTLLRLVVLKLYNQSVLVEGGTATLVNLRYKNLTLNPVIQR